LIAWKIESDIVFLIKTMKKKHLEKALSTGEFRFSYPEDFSNNTGGTLNPAQVDAWDSRHFFQAENIFAYPIVGKNENGYIYGSGIKLADKTTMTEITGINKHTPFCSFRKITEQDFIERDGKLIFSLGDTVDRIQAEFGHDSFVLIAVPNEFINRIKQTHSCYGKSIIYGELSLEDVKEFEESEKDGFSQIKMFQKREIYDWQKEYRVILSPTETTESFNIHVGSIKDIAYGGDIEELRLGFALGKSKEDFIKRNDE